FPVVRDIRPGQDPQAGDRPAQQSPQRSAVRQECDSAPGRSRCRGVDHDCGPAEDLCPTGASEVEEGRPGGEADGRLKMSKAIACVLMRAGTSRGPFFLREWLPDGDEARD